MLRGRRWGIALAIVLIVGVAQAVVQFDNSFYSRRNKERSVRKSTSLIILHTTEAPSRSALRKLSDLGECHFCIDENGKVYRIIDHRRVAFHAGRSMWNGRANVDDFSIGIEVCGYHNKPLNMSQVRALADLVGEMKAIYKIPDQRVLAHSHVAYGTPNKWQKRSHRGRKRCGMQFGTAAMRSRLNLKSRPAYDPDVRAGRLVAADEGLAQILYGQAPACATVVATPTRATSKAATKSSVAAKPQIAAAESSICCGGDEIQKGRSAWDIARDAYNHPTTIYTFPDGSQKQGHQIADFKLIPAGTKVAVKSTLDNLPESFKVVGRDGKGPDITGKESLLVSTIYVYPNGRYRRGNQMKADDILKLPYGTKVLLGYALGGPITAKRPASSFCNNQWRDPDTFFLLEGVLVPGSKVDDKKIPAGTVFFYKR